MTLIYLTGGIVTIEYLFRVPGTWYRADDSWSRARHTGWIQAVVLLLASVYVLVNLLADLLTVFLDPRLRDTGADEYSAAS